VSSAQLAQHVLKNLPIEFAATKPMLITDAGSYGALRAKLEQLAPIIPRDFGATAAGAMVRGDIGKRTGDKERTGGKGRGGQSSGHKYSPGQNVVGFQHYDAGRDADGGPLRCTYCRRQYHTADDCKQKRRAEAKSTAAVAAAVVPAAAAATAAAPPPPPAAYQIPPAPSVAAAAAGAPPRHTYYDHGSKQWMQVVPLVVAAIVGGASAWPDAGVCATNAHVIEVEGGLAAAAPVGTQWGQEYAMSAMMANNIF